MRIRRGAELTAVAVLAVVAACSGGSGDGPAGIGGSLPPPSEDGRSLEVLLGTAPASLFDSEESTADYVDVALAKATVGLADASPEELLEQVTTMFVDTVQTPPELFAQRGTELEAFREELGFTILDVERSLDVLAPPDQALIMETSVPPGQIDDAVRSDPVWSDLLTTDSIDGHTFYDWDGGEDTGAPDLERSTAARPLGRGGQLAVDDGTVIRTVSRRALAATFAAIDEPATSVAARDDVAPLLAAVDGDVVQGYLQARPPVGWSGPALLVDLVDAEADGRVEEGSTERRARLVLAAADGEEAGRRAETIRSTYTDATSLAFGTPFPEVVPEMTVTTEGSLVIVESTADLAFAQLRIVLQTGDTLFDLP